MTNLRAIFRGKVDLYWLFLSIVFVGTVALVVGFFATVGSPEPEPVYVEPVPTWTDHQPGGERAKALPSHPTQGGRD